ncbi:TetR/AcrR family transcriptional regulator [Yinghuangia sp. ASG 101]|uniref:TetR/AcrR family transcriptional regulator n=1 Tax=Yinghuangia sp. ASG 101 TaxID=2896848 RepID=UPI001E3B45EA|nr:TetR/AcrR family transcriptional regulator [Yinghuangia sp. ASG 101]UGQ11030.1 TetR/AcrR family transcriptional regulator [Yinghuangia sp. ASG 101]
MAAAQSSRTAPRRGSPRGPYRKGNETRAHIVDAAAKVFAERGYAGGSLRQIAAEVGVTAASLVQHFGSKEGLLNAVLRHWDAMAVQPSHTDRVGIAFFEGLPDLLRHHMEHRGLITLILTLRAEATGDTHPAHTYVRERQRQAVDEYSAKLAEAIARGDVPHMTDQQVNAEARALLAAMNGMQADWLIDPRLDVLALFGAHLDVTLARWRDGRVMRG